MKECFLEYRAWVHVWSFQDYCGLLKRVCLDHGNIDCDWLDLQAVRYLAILERINDVILFHRTCSGSLTPKRRALSTLVCVPCLAPRFGATPLDMKPRSSSGAGQAELSCYIGAHCALDPSFDAPKGRSLVATLRGCVYAVYLRITMQ